MKTLRACNVWMRHHEVSNISVLRQGERVLVCATLNVVWLPLPRPVAVGIIVTCSVFPYSAIAIFIDTFSAQNFVLTNLINLNLYKSARISQLFFISAGWTFTNHLCDVTISIQIGKAISIHHTVTVIINRDNPRTWTMR